MTNNNFFIPNGIEYYMPDEAKKFDKLRSQTIKIFDKYGYGYVIPPIADSLVNLLNLNSSDLQEKTLSFQDSNTGDKFGIRADITPQIAKVDLHLSKHKNVSNKIAYLGDIIRVSHDQFDRINPYQVGAEYFGDIKPSADIELIKILVEILTLSKDSKILIELGDLSIINQLLNSLSLNVDDKNTLISLINIKSKDEIIEFFAQKKLKQDVLKIICDLITFNGEIKLLSNIKNTLNNFSTKLYPNLKDLEYIAKKIIRLKGVYDVHIDLCNLNTLNYQTGIIYTAYIQNMRKEIAKGGRYMTSMNNNGRQASGFSLDLKDLYNIISGRKYV